MDQPPDMSQGETAYTALLQSLRDGDLRPGDRLREVDLCARLDLSRTPIREALRRLEADGIVEHRPRLGAVVRTLSHAELVELYDMRRVLDRTAAEMAAKHATPAELDDLSDINDLIRTCAQPAQAAALNQQFHTAIYLATRNRFLLDAARALNNALLLLGPTTLTDAARITIVAGQHHDIIEALRAGSPIAAGEAAQTHLETSLRYRLKALRT